ncbi:MULTISPECIES: DUF4224 domain-containing protein [Yersinia pseudotuberculosis complex]|uniref:DUF4224 domain-containing protein n=1 Tax=Yersinia pseudotuberculosis serotype O:1b (strain IP 31758) TaxID=349747 RepID=A0A0U1QY52_YERP3|nr:MULTISPECIES: DUF4224 domain-containing protein [Yersinia pseudotuberculosis complex]ABS47618.1 conserved hypothetical protein [Yersinia pseudotuberculosis IP 31758]AJK16389.1 hypothetical protein BZ19_1171 [Yersinia pseudotuberculosis str. PA3606]MCE4113746.1 DUF4224 domain-containing protein [Yersinia pseudotuberculosis]MCF1165064.1 DUF4224 domain-containing protein [Yersinia pseudotuberculosis]RYC28140.1 DUF4224 domain-containing protein [Yersinia pseudotuberculosis]
MKNEHDVITKEEMIELTGHRYKSKQCESLRRAGIFFIERLDGHPKTTWGHFLNPVGLRGKAAEQEKEEPNFEVMNNGR